MESLADQGKDETLGYKFPSFVEVDGKRKLPWLNLIHEANAVTNEQGDGPLFGEPLSTGPWWAGGYVEEYVHARVIHEPQGDAKAVIVGSKTAYGNDVLKEAERRLNG